MYRLKTLGGVRIEGPDGPLTGPASQRRRLAVLSLLAVGPGGMSRDRLVAFLWPESREERARHALSQLLYGVRRALGPDVVTGTATALRLNAAALTSDIGDLNAALERGDLERAIDLYEGPFLDGFYLDGCGEFERWAETERHRVQGRVGGALRTLARRAAASGDGVAAVGWWRRLAALDPLDAETAFALVKALAQAGDRAGALRHAREHHDVVRNEIGVAPDPRLSEYVATLAAEGPAPVSVRAEWPGSPADPAMAASTPAGVASAGAADPAIPTPSPSAPAGGRHRYPVRIGVSLLLAATATLAIAGIRGGALGSMPASVEPDGVIIASVENASGDPVFDRTVPLALAVGLRPSPRVYVVSPQRLRQALERMRLAPDSVHLDESLARELARREGVRMVLVPAVAGVGAAGYEITARFIEAESGSVLVFDGVSVRTREAVIAGLDRLGRQLRKKLGEPAVSVARRASPLPRATTASLEALEKFADGGAAFNAGRLTEAGALFGEAVAIDPGFATAHAALGVLAYWTNRRTDGDAHFERALATLGTVPERERILIRARVESWRGNRAAAVAMLRPYLAQNPQDLEAWNRLGYDLLRSGLAQEAGTVFERIVALDSTDFTALINLATADKAIDRYERALVSYRRAFALMPELETGNSNLNLEYGGALVLAGQPDSAELAFARMLGGERNVHARGLRSLAFLAMYRGRYADAAARLTEAIAANRAADAALSEVRNRLLLVTALGHLGQADLARVQLDSAWALSRRAELEPTMLHWLGKALARAGDVERAEKLVEQVAAVARAESQTDQAALEGLRGEVRVARSRAEAAVPHLESALRLDSTRLTLEALARGVAAAGDDRRAAALFQELTRGTEFGWEGQEAWHTAEYRLGRVLERSSRPALAAAAYERFLSLCQEADAALPLIADARQRLARLRPSEIHR